MEVETTLSVKNMSAADIKLESLFDVAVRGETNTLVGRWASADVMFSVEDSNMVGEERVCMHMCLAYDERGVDEEFFLFRSDGAVLKLDVSPEQLDVLFDAEVTALDDGTQTSNEGGVETNLDVIRYSYAVTNQQGVVEVLNNLLNDSSPCSLAKIMEERQRNPREKEETCARIMGRTLLILGSTRW